MLRTCELLSAEPHGNKLRSSTCLASSHRRVTPRCCHRQTELKFDLVPAVDELAAQVTVIGHYVTPVGLMCWHADVVARRWQASLQHMLQAEGRSRGCWHAAGLPGAAPLATHTFRILATRLGLF